jgi:phospholipase C
VTSRRKFLQSSLFSAAALAAFPPSIRKALAIPANNRTGSINDVEHVVILMQENRSFDHYFGTLRGVRGFGDRFGIPLPGGRKVWEQQIDANGTVVLPYHLDGQQGNAQRVSGTPHGWSDGQNAWDNGRQHQWPRYKNPQSMAYYKEAELPFQFALANAFTICDAYHCGMHSSTNPNRLFLWAGGNGPAGAGVSVLDNTWDTLNSNTNLANGFDWKTVPESLQETGVSWKVYQNMPDNYTDNPLVGFTAYRQANLASGKPVYHNRPDAQNPAYDPALDAIAPLYKGIANTLPGANEETQLEAFRSDVRNGRLPQVSWVVATDTYSEHPGPSSPVQGAWYIQQILDALTENPEVWSKTVLFVNFDENDGFFDHVPSPAAPSTRLDGTPAGKTTLDAADVAPERNDYPAPTGFSPRTPDGKVFGPGVRVPMYVVSPWSRGGWVNSEVADHTSVTRFLEVRFGFRYPGISGFRRAVCGDLVSTFNFARPNGEPLPTLAGRRSKAEADALRTAQQALPQVVPQAGRGFPLQATGTRPSRALPYQLHVHAATDEHRGTVTLAFANAGRAAAVFHVYDQLHMDRMPQRYAVEPGKSLADDWAAGTDDAGRYDLWVLGPNGFHRHFKGDLGARHARHAPAPEVRVSYDPAGGGLRLEGRNDGPGQVVLTVRSNRLYGPLKAGRSRTLAGSEQARGNGTEWQLRLHGRSTQSLYWDLDSTGWWYDFVVTCDADPAFERRLAGRVETGRHSVSDPAMGMADEF